MLFSGYTNLIDVASKSRRILFVLSPGCINNKWDSVSIYNALKQLTTLGPQLSCVTLVQLPSQTNETKNAQGETLSTLLRNIAVIHWGKYHDEKFWLSILLQLPPKRNQQGIVQNIVLNHNDSSKRLNDDCRERLDYMV